MCVREMYRSATLADVLQSGLKLIVLTEACLYRELVCDRDTCTVDVMIGHAKFGTVYIAFLYRRIFDDPCWQSLLTLF